MRKKINIPDIHIGNIIRRELKIQNLTITWLAEQVGYLPNSLGKTLKNKDIYTDLLFRISVALEVDFFEYISKKLKRVCRCKIRLGFPG